VSLHYPYHSHIFSSNLDNRHQPPVPVNASLCDLLELVRNTKDPWLLFLYVARSRLSLETHPAHRKALFLSRLSRREEAIEYALLSIAGYPWNWSTWTLLGSCIGDGEEVTLSDLILTIAC